MKHILNNISESEREEILNHYQGQLKIDNSKFNKLVENKLGDVKPILSEQSAPAAKPQIDPKITELRNEFIASLKLYINNMEKSPDKYPSAEVVWGQLSNLNSKKSIEDGYKIEYKQDPSTVPTKSLKQQITPPNV